TFGFCPFLRDMHFPLRFLAGTDGDGDDNTSGKDALAESETSERFRKLARSCADLNSTTCFTAASHSVPPSSGSHSDAASHLKGPLRFAVSLRVGAAPPNLLPFLLLVHRAVEDCSSLPGEDAVTRRSESRRLKPASCRIRYRA